MKLILLLVLLQLLLPPYDCDHIITMVQNMVYCLWIFKPDFKIIPLFILSLRCPLHITNFHFMYFKFSYLLSVVVIIECFYLCSPLLITINICSSLHIKFVKWQNNYDNNDYVEVYSSNILSGKVKIIYSEIMSEKK